VLAFHAASLSRLNLPSASQNYSSSVMLFIRSPNRSCSNAASLACLLTSASRHSRSYASTASFPSLPATTRPN